MTRTPAGLKRIDYGSFVVPASDEDCEHICRRAFLSYRSHSRSDLKSLMTRSLTDDDMPELDGLEQFKRTVDTCGPDDPSTMTL